MCIIILNNSLDFCVFCQNHKILCFVSGGYAISCLIIYYIYKIYSAKKTRERKDDMTKMRKIICLLLVFALCFAVGCSKKPTTETPAQTNPVVEDDYVSDRELAEKDAEQEGAKDAHTVTAVDFGDLLGYQIVYPKGDEQLRQAANKLAAYLAENEITAEVVSDDAAKKDKEMLIGDTNRMESDLADNKYAVTVEGDKLFFG